MADTYYGYAERTAENQIDWATIGKDLSKALSDEAIIRKDKQSALETSIRETTKKISNAEVGPSSLGNKRLAEYAGNLTEGFLTASKLWKSGQMSTQQYTEFINNAKNGTDVVLDLNKDYQDEFKRMKERAESADPATRSQLLEQWEKGEVGEYGTLNNTQYYLDPTTGMVNLAKIKRETIDGKEVVTMGDEFITAMDAKARLKNEYNYFDSGKATTDIAASLGTNIIEIREKGGPSSAGIIRSITDPRYRKDLNDKDAKLADLFESAVNQQIEGTASNPLNVSSFLTNDVRVDPLTGKAYTFTRDPKAQTSTDVILLKVDEMGRSYPDLSTEIGRKQLQVYKEKMREQVVMKIDTKEELDTYTEPEPNYTRTTGDENEKPPKDNLYQHIRSAWLLSKTNSAQSAAQLTALSGGNYIFKWEKGGVQVYKTDKYGNQGSPIGSPVTRLDSLQKYFYNDWRTYDREKREAGKPSTTTRISTSKYNKT